MASASTRVRRRIDDEQNPVRPAHLCAGTTDTFRLDGVRGHSQSRGVDDAEWQSIDLDSLTQDVARCAGFGCDDRGVMSRESIQQARLARVRTAGDDYDHAVAQKLAAPRIRFERTQRLEHAVQACGEFTFGEKVDLLLGKIDRRFDKHAQIDHRLGEPPHFIREFAAQGTHRGACCGCSRAVDEIRNSFRLREIDLVVQKRALAELAGPRQAGAAFHDAADDQIDDDRSAVTVQLKDIFAREGIWRWEEERDAHVDRLARRIDKSAVARQARLGNFAKHRLRDGAAQRARHTHDREPAAPGRRCRCHDRLWNCSRHRITGVEAAVAARYPVRLTLSAATIRLIFHCCAIDRTVFVTQ